MSEKESEIKELEEKEMIKKNSETPEKELSNIVFVPPELNKISSLPVSVSLPFQNYEFRKKKWTILSLI